MRHLSIFFALLFAPLTLSAQTSSMQYAPPRPTQACPVYMAVHRTGGLAAVQTGAPAPAEQEKMRARILDL